MVPFVNPDRTLTGVRRLVKIHVDHTAVIHLDEVLPVVMPSLREPRDAENSEIGMRSLFAQGSVTAVSLSVAGLGECHHSSSSSS